MKSALALCAVLATSLLSLPTAALAHTGGALDHYGCHADRREGNYHCHQGNLKGYSFPSHDAMIEAVRTGHLPEKPPEKEGFFSKYWPFGSKKDNDAQAVAPASAQAAAPQESEAQAATPAPARDPGSNNGRPVEERLRILSGLRDMGLITNEEYEARRKAILEQI